MPLTLINPPKVDVAFTPLTLMSVPKVEEAVVLRFPEISKASVGLSIPMPTLPDVCWITN